MTRSISHLHHPAEFANAIHLHPTVESVAQYNVLKLQQNEEPIAILKAVHSGPNAASASVDDASGLHPVLSIARNARVMLTCNLWVEAGLVNGAMGKVQSICYMTGGPPELPVAVMVKFDRYSGPTLHDGSVPIVPLRRTWSTSSSQPCSHLQLPLKLAWGSFHVKSTKKKSTLVSDFSETWFLHSMYQIIKPQ